MTELRVSKIGLPFIKVGDKEALPCTFISYSMTINGVHACSVGLAVGLGISSGDATLSAEDIMLYVQSPENKKKGLISCEITEVDPDTNASTVILKGYVLSAQLLYQAGIASSAQVRLDCFGPAAKLLASPCSAYIETTYGDVINRLTSGAQVDFNSAQQSGNNWLVQVVELTPDVITAARGKTVAEVASVCIAAAKLAASQDSSKIEINKEGDAVVNEALGGKTALDTTLKSSYIEGNFVTELFDSIIKGIQTGSILDVLIRTLCSDTFMLQLVPRWSVDKPNDFKLEVAPCEAWEQPSSQDKSADIELTSEDIVGIRADYGAAALLSTPDVLLVNYSEVYSWLYGHTKAAYGPLLGIACLDTKLQTDLRDKAATGKVADILNSVSKLKLKDIKAPNWLTLGAVGDPSSTTAEDINRDNTQGIGKAENTPAELKDEKKKDTGLPQILTTPGSALRNTANKIAEALFFKYYLANDKVHVALVPSLRFGKDPDKFFEQNLGRTVSIDLTGACIKDSKLRIKGELTTINYEGRFGERSSANYTIVLSRVRHADTEVPIGKCPIYTK